MSFSAVSGPTPESRAALREDVLASLRENSPLVLFTVFYGLAPIVVARMLSIPSLPYGSLLVSYIGVATTMGIAMFAAFALWYLYHARIRKVPNFQVEAWQRLRNDFLRRDRLLLALPVLALWPITANAFSYLKSAIPLIQPFHLDPVLHQWDRTIHFGIDPWRILQPFLGYTWITYGINFLYALWFIVLHLALLLQSAAIEKRKLRMQFLLSMAFAWALIGNLAATLMSSAGPCYYGQVVDGVDPYAPLMSYLRGVAGNLSLNVIGHELRLPFTALQLQDMLWRKWLGSDFSIGAGISAAPSMHVASSWLIARVAWASGGKIRIFGSLFLLVIFFGSIHLGWHYAVDGYLAMAGAWAIWRLTGWLLERPVMQMLLWPTDSPSRTRESQET
jgi:PAP2 superfamily protein